MVDNRGDWLLHSPGYHHVLSGGWASDSRFRTDGGEVLFPAINLLHLSSYFYHAEARRKNDRSPAGMAMRADNNVPNLGFRAYESAGRAYFLATVLRTLRRCGQLRDEGGTVRNPALPVILRRQQRLLLPASDVL